MATRLYLLSAASSEDLGSDERQLSATRGGSLATQSTATVAGPTSGVFLASGTGTLSWCMRVNAFTLAGTVTLNFWMSESNMSANVDMAVRVHRYTGASPATFASTPVTGTGVSAELPVTTRAAQNDTRTPTSTAFNDGDLLVVQVVGDDAGTMATGFTFDLGFNGATAAADGDSWVEFTETVTEYVVAAERVPRFTPYPQLLAH